MTKHMIVHSCGHEAEHELHGSRSSRNGQVGNRRLKPCPRCWKAGVDSHNAESAALAEQRHWPELTGTGRQTSWAQGLRADLVDSLPYRMTELVDMATARGQTFANTREAVALAAELALEQTSAAWWIEHRKQPGQALLDVPGVRLRLKAAGDTGKTAAALILWAGAAL